MQANEPGCKKYPDVCGSLSDRVLPNPHICQLPPGHRGLHDYDDDYRREQDSFDNESPQPGD